MSCYGVKPRGKGRVRHEKERMHHGVGFLRWARQLKITWRIVRTITIPEGGGGHGRERGGCQIDTKTRRGDQGGWQIGMNTSRGDHGSWEGSPAWLFVEVYSVNERGHYNEGGLCLTTNILFLWNAQHSIVCYNRGNALGDNGSVFLDRGPSWVAHTTYPLLEVVDRH